ncbi:MAG TPA: helical backbone metal receptor [Cyclobacteriaceae bacterium]|nr:helical backbone metal receptor [Cyclobacteriaceae bacterium]
MTKVALVDQLGTRIEIDAPKRIISLVPSQTELLYELGLDDRVVGITKFCVHPERWHKSKAIVGGTKNFHFDIIEKLAPDLIIGNKEENYETGIGTLRKRYPVWMSDIVNFDDAISMIRSIAALTQTEEKGKEIIHSIESAFSSLQKIQLKRTLYLMWREPWMGAANGTFIHTMMEKAGLTNVLRHEDRYPELSAEKIRALNPELVLLSSEPFPFREKHINEIETILPKSEILLVDGEMFSWYGSRLRLAPAYFTRVLAGS